MKPKWVWIAGWIFAAMFLTLWLQQKDISAELRKTKQFYDEPDCLEREIP